MLDVILIASYGCEDNLENLILKLTEEENINLILVDNALKKKGKEIISFYASKLKAVLVKNNNYSIKLAKERGLARANNEYICFISGNDSFEKGYFSDIYDENYDIILPGNSDRKITQEDFVSEKVSNSFYGKIIKRKILSFRTPLNYDEQEAFYKFDDSFDIYQKKTNKYNHVIKLLLRKEFSDEYHNYTFSYEQYKFFENKKELKKIAIENMIKYGNIAYAKMFSDKDRYKVELSNIKNCYVCLKNDCDAKFDKKVFNKIKDGKFKEGDFQVQKFKLIKTVNKKIKEIVDDIKPKKKEKTKKKIKVKK